MSLSLTQDLAWQNAVMRQKLWASNKKVNRSEWFFLVDTRHKPTSEQDKARSERYCDGVMEEFTRELQEGNIITLNKKKHQWNQDYIDSTSVRYVVELGLGKMKKDGTRGASGGTIHIHALVTVIHHSNISLTQETLADFFVPRLQTLFGKRPFVGRPRLTNQNRVVEYMEKGFEEAEWKQVDF